MSAPVAPIVQNEAPNWSPKSESNVQLKENMETISNAFQHIFITPNKSATTVMAVSNASPGSESKFILQATAFMNTKAYVIAGKEFPKSAEEFVKKVPKEAWDRLKRIDWNVESETNIVFSTIGKMCDDFYTQSLFHLVDRGVDAITYSEKSLDELKDIPGENLYDQLMVLCDAKYKSPADQDEAYTRAKKLAHTTLDNLSATANEAKTQALNLVAAMQKFRSESREISGRLKDLYVKYAEKEVEGKKGYACWLSEDLHQLTTSMWDKVAVFNKQYDDWKTFTGLAVGLGVGLMIMPLIGAPLMVGFSIKAAALKRDYDQSEKDFKKLQQEMGDEGPLVDLANKFVHQFGDLDEKLELAVNTIQDLCGAYSDQGTAYSTLKAHLDGLIKGAENDDSESRRNYVDWYMKKTIADLNTLRDAAKGYIDAVNHEIV